jgi:hypothetical protein
MLSFHIEPGFFKPQEGHTGADRLTSFLQLGQRSAVFFDVFILVSRCSIAKWWRKQLKQDCAKGLDGGCSSFPVGRKTGTLAHPDLRLHEDDDLCWSLEGFVMPWSWRPTIVRCDQRLH